MMMKKKWILFLTAGFIACTINAQSILLQRADRQFKLYQYARAVELYEKYITKDSTDVYALKRLAGSYRLMNKPEKSEIWYARLMQFPEKSVEDIYYYAQALKENGKKEKSDYWMEEFAKRSDTDLRALRFINQAPEKMNSRKIEIKNLAVNTGNMEFGPAFYRNQVVFSSSRGEANAFKPKNARDKMLFLDMYVAGKDEQGELSGARKFSEDITTKFHEGPATFNPEGTKIYFTRNYFKSGKLGINESRTNNLVILRAELQGNVWTNEKQLPFNSQEYSTGHPSISFDGQKLYFASDMPGGFGGTDIYVCQWKDSDWGEPENLGKNVNTEGNEMFPFIHNSGILFFASDGHIGLGGLDLFMSMPVNEQFISVTHLGSPLNSTKDDFALIVAESGKSGYFSSNREGGKGNDDLYYFETDDPFRTMLMLTLHVVDQAGRQRIAEASVTLFDENGAQITGETTGSEGEVTFRMDYDKKYSVTVKKPGYQENTGAISTFDKADIRKIVQNVYLDKAVQFSLYGIITDHKTKEILEGVNVVLIDNQTKKELLHTTTDRMGDFSYILSDKKSNDRVNLQIKLKKEGFIPKSIPYNMVLTQPGTIELHESLDISLEKIDVGIDIGRLLDIRPIKFDINRWNIRPDAARELNKVVAFMKKHPTMVIELGSHTDSRGNDDYNLQLSENRANASAEYIISQGIGRSRITGKGYGESRLVNRCGNGVACSEKEHQQNRRTEFIIVKM